VQAMIEFTPDGKILTANDNFLRGVIRSGRYPGTSSQHVRRASYARSPDYAAFWKKLQAGEFVAAEFRRIGKNGKIVWLQASYNPIFDHKGRVIKVVKFATDVTSRVEAIDAIAEG
jgi:methyl-accepting chemotaxis protein